MRRYIVLLLITGTVWAQTGLDKLVLKNDTEYLGEYSRKDFKLYTYNLDYIDQEVIYFKPLEAFAFQPVTVDAIKVLQLRDGTLLYNTEGKITEKKLFWTFVIALFGIFLYSSHSNSSSGSGGGGKVFLGDGPPI
tara:strand:+ start:3065 stop:3469 length:405 start_codon:yes stop_codon:yes gene_type:complete